VRRIEIITPAPPKSLHGNRITAQRWQGFLRKLGYKTTVSESWSGNASDLFIALHAYRSHASMMQFKTAFPNARVILMMTGTDLYRDMPQHPEVHKSMRLADAIVVLQQEAMESIPAPWKYKTQVIYQSVKKITRKPLLKRSFLVSVIGHLREEKDPFCIVRSLVYLDPRSQIKVQHLGKAMTPEMRTLAKQYSQKEERYTWFGELPHRKALQQIARSHILLITSQMEGGAHVVSEAIASGTPVIASAIPGNRGLLGANYSGYFPVGDEKALAQLLQRAETDPKFYHLLEKQVCAQHNIVEPKYELRAIKKLVEALLKTSKAH
jgi:putative glycosyltransferase (TIGR04348 family)